MNLKYFVFVFFASLFFFSCGNSETKTPKNQEENDPKSVTIRNFTFPEFSEEAEKTISEWYDLKTLYQILVSIAPQQKNVTKLLQNTNPDSLYVFKRLYLNHSRNLHSNANIVRDWRMGELPSDTIYQFVKIRKDDFSSFGWKEILLSDIPYTFSFRVKTSQIKHIKIEVLREKDHKIIAEQIIRLDSVQKNELKPHTKLSELSDNWLQIETKVETPLQGNYSFTINYSDQEPENEYVMLYRSQLLLPVKYREEVDKSSEKLIRKDAVIRSSYNGIYFWLFQLEDELKQVWVKNNFPEKINTSGVKSRLKLFQTYVEELSDSVKNNPELTDEQIHLGIRQIKESFASFITYINFLHRDNLDLKMKEFIDENPQETNLNP